MADVFAVQCAGRDAQMIFCALVKGHHGLCTVGVAFILNQFD